MNILSIADLDTTELAELSADPLARRDDGPDPQHELAGGTLAFLFEQPSLRTMSSFAAAGVKVGLSPIAIATTGNPFRDQTDFQDEVQQLSLIARCVVVRSSAPLVPEAYDLCPAPIVNGGDGNNEHPTQTLIDLAVMRHFGLEGSRVAIMGNMRDHRTAHSLALALQRLDVDLRLVFPEGLAMEARYLGGGRVEAVQADTFETRDEAIRDADFVYMLPTMSLSSPDRMREAVYSLDLAQAQRVLKPDAKILHPFPRFGELARDLDYSSFDAYHMQTSFGPLVRERVLRHVIAPAMVRRPVVVSGSMARA